MIPGPHLTQERLESMARGHLNAADQLELQAHLSVCSMCQAAASALSAPLAATQEDIGFSDTHQSDSRPARTYSDPEMAPILDMQPGKVLGRYTVTRQLGRGAMGIVLEARDSRLDRAVAIKVLRPDVPVVESLLLRERLIKEAKALASLSHPNVISVHDVVEFDDSVFIAMDYVEGTTLTEWMKTTRDFESIRRTFLEAGAGLWAAHQAGLIHRDFKPDNVLVGNDGRVRVSDFGVARRVGKNAALGEDTMSSGGSIIGTPAYMSPEQFDGKPADARSDQFSFCVALYEALFGQRPFLAASLKELKLAVHRGVVLPPLRRHVPRFAAELVLKGLAVDPNERFASLDQLLLALATKRTSKRLVAAFVVGALGLAVGGASVAQHLIQQRDSPCYSFEKRLQEIVNNEAIDSVANALKPLATSLAPKQMTQELTRFSFEWSRKNSQACERGTMNAIVQTCLDEQLLTVKQLMARLAMAEPRQFEMALEQLQSVSEEDCSRPNDTLFVLPSDELAAKEYLNLYSELNQVKRMLEASEPTNALALAQRLDIKSHEFGFKPLTALARLLRGKAAEGTSGATNALQLYEEAELLAEAARAESVVFQARLLSLQRNLTIDVSAAQKRLPSLKASLERNGSKFAEQIAVLSSEAQLAIEQRNVPLAKTLFAQMQKKENESTTAPLLRHKMAAVRALGLVTFGLADENMFQSALLAATQDLGAEHSLSLELKRTYLVFLGKQHRDEEALALAKELQSFYEKRDPNSQHVQAQNYNIGQILERLKRHDEAQKYLEASSLPCLSGSQHWNTSSCANVLSGYAEFLQKREQFERALSTIRRGRQIRELVVGPTAPQVAMEWSVEGGILSDMKRYDEASACTRKALQLMEHENSDEVLKHVTRYDLVEELWHNENSRIEAHELALEVQRYFESRGKNFEEYTKEVTTWISQHPLPKNKMKTKTR
jgi:eukaryotic-like serine/threonine-protein kinase